VYCGNLRLSLRINLSAINKKGSTKFIVESLVSARDWNLPAGRQVEQHIHANYFNNTTNIYTIKKTRRLKSSFLTKGLVPGTGTFFLYFN
jgi:hypothetical protein